MQYLCNVRASGVFSSGNFVGILLWLEPEINIHDSTIFFQMRRKKTKQDTFQEIHDNKTNLFGLPDLSLLNQDFDTETWMYQGESH